jgi:exodeoxyribonuclease VII large subunit
MSQPAFDFDLDDGSEPTYTVSELADAINGSLRRSFHDGVWIRGEIQGWNERGPHAYFRLAEELDVGKAVLNVQFFAPARARLRPLLVKSRLRLADGLKVRVFGHLDFFAGSGQLGLKMSGIDPRYTLGELAMQRDDVLRQLRETGLIDANRKRSLAAAPLHVGVVTSIGSAAWADFVHEIERSGWAFNLRVIDVRVQGESAVSMVASAITTLARRRDLDCVVVVRGGGARSELATFDHSDIAMAIATSPLPVFTGLGHEVDRSVADEVAHSALKTPTACAAALVEHVGGFMASAEHTWAAIARHGEQGVRDATVALDEVATGISLRTQAAVDRSNERLLHRVDRLRSGSHRVLERAESQMANAGAAVARVPQRLDPEVRHLDAVAARLRLLDPVHTMARGWSITRTADGRTVRSADQVAVGDQLITTFANGTATSRVEETT